MRKLWFLLILLFLLPFGHESFAQINRKSIKKSNRGVSAYRGSRSRFGKNKQYTSIGFSVNALNYYGDLSPRPQKVSTDISFTKPGFALSVMHRFGPRYTLQGQFMYGILKGSDAESADPNDLNNGIYRYKRNLSFRNQIKELSVVAVVDLFENDANYLSKVKWTPYVYVGLAGFHHNPQAIAPARDLQGNVLPEGGQWVKLRPLGTEGQYSTLSPTDVNVGIKPYSTIQFAIPFGVGVRLKLTELMDLSADLGFRFTFTDYLDDVSKNYVDLDKLTSPLAQAMSYRTNELLGNPPAGAGLSTASGVTVYPGYGSEHRDNLRGSKADGDIYMVTSIKLSYIIGATYHRAKFR